MKLLRPRNFFIFAMTALSGTVLLHTSQSVQNAEARLEALESSTQREQEKIRLLKAEWASLNRPERLEKMARQFLDLVPPQPETMVDEVSVLPDRPSDDESKGLFENEGAEAVVQPIAIQAPAEREKSAAKKESVKPSKGFGDLMKEWEGGQ